MKLLIVTLISYLCLVSLAQSFTETELLTDSWLLEITSESEILAEYLGYASEEEEDNLLYYAEEFEFQYQWDNIFIDDIYHPPNPTVVEGTDSVGILYGDGVSVFVDTPSSGTTTGSTTPATTTNTDAQTTTLESTMDDLSDFYSLDAVSNNSTIGVYSQPNFDSIKLTEIQNNTRITFVCQAEGPEVTGLYGTTTLWNYVPEYSGFIPYAETSSRSFEYETQPCETYFQESTDSLETAEDVESTVEEPQTDQIQDITSSDGLIEIKYTDGGVYKGEAADRIREGNGTMTWPNGEVYEGMWVNDKREGAGTMTYPDGVKFEVEWVQDVPKLDSILHVILLNLKA